MEDIEHDSKRVASPSPPPPSSSSPPLLWSCGLFAVAERLDCVLMLLGSIGACIHGAAPPVFFVLVGQMIDSLGSFSSNHRLLSSRISQLSMYLVYLGLVMLVSSWIGVATWKQTGERQAARMRLKYMSAVLKKDIHYFETEAQNKSLIFQISSDTILVQDAIGDKIGHCVRYLSQSIVGMIIGFVLVWQLTLVTVAIIPLMVVAGAYTVILSNLSQKAETAYAESGKIAEENLSQIRTVYAFGGESRAIKAYTKSLRKAIELGKKSGVTKGIGMGLTFALLLCTWALLLWYASVLVRHQKTNGGKAFATIFNVIFSGFALGHAAPNLAAIAKGNAAATNIVSMIDNEADSSKRLVSGLTLPRIVGEIEFREVCFSYPSRPNNMIFDCLSFSVTAGKTFAFVGPSGSGKSTIISLVQRFYDLTSGTILLDGHVIEDLQLKWLREQMGLVNQEPVLFATSILENILYGKEGADMEQVMEAAKAANAHSFIQDLPHGYHTQVGEGGTLLSGGQKQRIAITRAILRNPKILLLDEATSALDLESEHIVQKALDGIMSNRTTIVVAHRLSTIKNVDQIIVLNNGTVVETGTHLELTTKQGEYAKLINLQVSELGNEDRNSTIAPTSINHQQPEESRLTRPSTLTENNIVVGSPAKDPTPSFKELVKLNKSEWLYALLGSIGAILTGIQVPLFALGITNMLTAFYSNVEAKIKHDVQVTACLFLVVAAITVPIYLLQHYFYTVMGERITSRIRLAMFSAMLSNEPGWFDSENNNVGTLLSKLAADATLVRTTLVERLSTVVQNTSLVVAAFVIAFKFSWRIAAVTVTIFPLLIGASLTEKYFLKGFGGNNTIAYSRANSLAREAIANIRTVAAFGTGERISEQFALELRQPMKKALVWGHISGFGYGLSQFLSFCSYALTLWYASVLIKQRSDSFGDIITSFMVLIVTAFAVAEASVLTSEIMKGSEALRSVFTIISRKTIIDSAKVGSKIVVKDIIKGNIEFKEVRFEYPTRTQITVLNDLNLKIPSGKCVAVVGQSGCGKSTLISLVMRFYDPSSGVVLLDQVDIRSLNLRFIRQKIGLVQQEPALFSTTVYDNIRYGNENATEVEIIQAAKAANAHEFITRMPEGYNTQVGGKGCELSGGQKQRVAIARAILRDPLILLLDEATSALDTASEKVVQEALDKVMQGRTTIVVAHRLSTIYNADSIVVMNHGRVVEIGSHEELLSIPQSIYAQLVGLQEVDARE
ncbi:ABC transporter B family member 13-like isoform X2 [Spinacia oleracea]|uniref:ABC transporter B family member 13-like isoform X2 n=1 Tax=Spinacia oleracea TaxID=3562 RepID=A0ABM3RJ33_SPIOL|nr:ABC transporter B family member 13-like isoform X2 [Spinacia oleracea]